MIERRVVFDLAVEFSNGGGIQGRGRGEPTGPDLIELSYPSETGCRPIRAWPGRPPSGGRERT